MPPIITERATSANSAAQTVICIMPVKNEAWILERSLACASTWADVIFVADQGSHDGTVAIASRFPKVQLIRNASDFYSEHVRQNLLLAAAREIPGRRVIFSLDADEIISANFYDNPEWSWLLQAPEGTAIRFPKAELLPGCGHYWSVSGGDLVHGFVDDGSPFVGHTIHGARLPMPEPLRLIRPTTVWLLHYRAVDRQRNDAKQRWYQCWEMATRPGTRPIILYRTYHQDLAIPPAPPRVPRVWFDGYEDRGIDMTHVVSEPHPWWDHEVVSLFRQHGLEAFRRLDVFGPWSSDLLLDGTPITDPRRPLDRLVHRWLRATQLHQSRLSVRLIQRWLRTFGW